MTPTWARARRVATIAVGIAALALPALAAGGVGSGDAVPATDGTVAAAPAADVATAAAAGTTGTATSAATAAVASASGTTNAVTATSTPDEGTRAATGDEAGSTETETVQRSCGAADDPHYVPSSGRDASECYDADGTFRPGRSYTATHYTNDVTCGAPYAYADGDVGPDGGYGYVQACLDDDALPINGRAVAQGDVDASGDFTASATADGDKDNPDETSQGWATATVSPDGPAYRCGKTYAEGGRADSDSPTSEDTADECG